MVLCTFNDNTRIGWFVSSRLRTIFLVVLIAASLFSSFGQAQEKKIDCLQTISFIFVNYYSNNKHDCLVINNEKHIINGLKVKFYVPKIDRWTWVIVDYHGDIITFERNIHWDFDKHQRLTPMWLHDQWLIENGIKI